MDKFLIILDNLRNQTLINMGYELDPLNEKKQFNIKDSI